MKKVAVTGRFDNIRSRQVRFLQEASKFGLLHVLLLSDEAIWHLEGAAPQFSQQERVYLLTSIRYVNQVTLVQTPGDLNELPQVAGFQPEVWAVGQSDDTPEKRAFCESMGMQYQVINKEVKGFPILVMHDGRRSRQKKVLVTGCFDWFHSGHVRFFEETSELGDLYVVIGHDDNIRLLKGDGHPMFSQDERCYMVQAIRFVKQALVSSGHGWMDAEPEIEMIRPDIYAVNEDGDKPEKRAFCEQHGLEYVVLKRTPKDGLPRRESRVLRGF